MNRQQQTILGSLLMELASTPAERPLIPIYGRDGAVVSRMAPADDYDIPPPRADSSNRYPNLSEDDADGIEHISYTSSAAQGLFASADTMKLDQPLNGWDDFFRMWMQNPRVSACVQKIAAAMAVHGWEIKPADGPDGKPIKTANPASGEFLHDWFSHCHPYQTVDQIFGTILPANILAGKYLAEIAFTQLKTDTHYGRLPGGIYPITAQGRIFARLKPGSIIFSKPAWKQVRDASETGGDQKSPILFDWEQILWLQFPNIIARGIFPVSPIEMLRLPIGTTGEAGRYIYDYFRTDGKNGMIYTIPGRGSGVDPMANIYARNFAESMKKGLLKKGNATKITVLHSGMTVEKSPALEKAGISFIDTMMMNGDQICGVFDVDPRLVSVDRGGSLGGKGEREQAYYELITNAVLPRVRHFNAAITKQVIQQGFEISDWQFKLRPAKTNPSEESRQTIANTARLLAGFRVFDTKNLDHINGLLKETFPDLPPNEKIPDALDVTTAGVEKDVVEVPVDDEVTPVEKPPAPDGTVAATRAKPKPRRPSKRATQHVPFLDAFESDLTADLAKSLKGLLAMVKDKLAAVYAAKDLKALKSFNFAPGGGAIKADGKRKLKAFYQASYDYTKKELTPKLKAAKAAVAAQSRSDPHVVKRGNIDDYVDLVSESYFDDLFGSVAQEARDTYMEGAKAGWSVNEFLQTLSDRFDDIDEDDIKTNVRTISTEFFNTARMEMFRNTDGAVETVEYTAIDDEALCDICSPFLGVIFRGMDDPNLAAAEPPLHWNCRCCVEAVMAGDEWSATDPSEVSDAMDNIAEGFGGLARSEGYGRRSRFILHRRSKQPQYAINHAHSRNHGH